MKLLTLLGNVHGALEMTDELLEIFPNHPRAMGNRVYYLNAIEKGVSKDDEKVIVNLKDTAVLKTN